MDERNEVKMTRDEFNLMGDDELQFIRGKQIKIVRDEGDKREPKVSMKDDFWD